MSDDSPSTGNTELDQIIAAYLQALEKGDSPDQEILKAEHPHLANQLQEFLDGQVEFRNPFDETKGFKTRSVIENDTGAAIGPYTLVKKIGEGGMGSVWRARQSAPIKRDVALKLIKPGMDSKQVLARFDSERQALALMDHPNIAKVFDAGTTDQGQPYFVMELVDGIPITKYCDRQKLTPQRRLELFIPVCQAIQHAHQKGIIHRDIKPGNVLVTTFDDHPVVKVIDFGVAKATGGSLTEETMETSFGAMVGTIQYMSPEQATLNNLDIDTRSDVYALGVLLYELLTGVPPFEKRELSKIGILEILQLIRDQDPVRPSMKLSSSDALPSISADRGTEPRHLTAILKTDLDWIAMKALEKDRARRYETANGLAKDIQRYLAGEPIEAHPPSRAYRCKKFLAKHRGPAIAASLILLALLAGVAGTTWGMLRARTFAAAERLAKDDAEEKRKEADAQRKQAETEKAVALAVREFLQQKLLRQASARTQADLLLRIGGSASDIKRNPTIRELLDRAAVELSPENIDENFPDQKEVQAELLQTIGDTYRSIGEYDFALEHMRRSLMTLENIEHVNLQKILTVKHRLSMTLVNLGKFPEATELLDEVVTERSRILRENHPDTLDTKGLLASALKSLGERQRAIELFELVLAAQKTELGDDHIETIITTNNLALAYAEDGKIDAAIGLLEQAWETCLNSASIGEDHPLTIGILNSLAAKYLSVQRFDEAIVMLQIVKQWNDEKLDSAHPNSMITLNNLAAAYYSTQRFGEAAGIFNEVLAVQTKTLDESHPVRIATLNNLAALHYGLKEFDEAIEIFEQIRKIQIEKLGEDNAATIATTNNLASVKNSAGDKQAALELYGQVMTGMQRLKFNHEHAQRMVPAIIKTFEGVGEWGKAESWRREWLVAVRNRSEFKLLDIAIELSGLGNNLVKQEKWDEAETVLKESVSIHEQNETETWEEYVVMSQLGDVLFNREQFAEAEPLLVSAYEGLKSHHEKIPEPDQKLIKGTAARLAVLYEKTGEVDKAKEWETLAEAGNEK